MKVIVATWYDDLGEPFINEYYTETIDVQALLTYYKGQKAVYGKSVIAEYFETLVFSDGNRVVLTLHDVLSKVETPEYTPKEEIIDVRAEYKVLNISPTGNVG